MTNILEIPQRERVVVVIRGAETATLGQELRALYEGGLRIFEVTVEAREPSMHLQAYANNFLRMRCSARAQYLTPARRRSSLQLVLGSSFAP